MVLVIGGPGASGCSTIAQRLADYFNIGRVYGGAVFREEAKSKGCDTLNDFYNSVSYNVLAEIDARVDSNFRELAKRGGVVIESKSFAALATKENIPCTAKIWVTADFDERVNRYFIRNNIGWFGRLLKQNKVRALLKERYDMDAKRYSRSYDIDYDNPELYNDLVIDTTKQSVDETFNTVINFLKERGYN